MSLADLATAAQRALLRETAGRLVKQQAKTADHTLAIAEICRARAAEKDRRSPEKVDYQEIAGAAGVDALVLHAVADAQSAGPGFDADGQLTIIVEPHIFSAESFHAFDDLANPPVSYPDWIRYDADALPPMNWRKHPYAMTLDERWALWSWQANLSFPAACASLRVGRYLMATRDWRDLGYPSAEAVLRRAQLGEREQLDLLFRFARRHNLTDAFKARDWLTIARAYNGPGQAQPFAARMADAVRKRTRLYQ
jgi:hypothetical protein